MLWKYIVCAKYFSPKKQESMHRYKQRPPAMLGKMLGVKLFLRGALLHLVTVRYYNKTHQHTHRRENPLLSEWWWWSLSPAPGCSPSHLPATPFSPSRCSRTFHATADTTRLQWPRRLLLYIDMCNVFVPSGRVVVCTSTTSATNTTSFKWAARADAIKKILFNGGFMVNWNQMITSLPLADWLTHWLIDCPTKWLTEYQCR